MKPERYQNLQKILNIVEPAHSGGNDRFCARLKTDISAPFQGGPGGGIWNSQKIFIIVERLEFDYLRIFFNYIVSILSQD
jgi:hypothetical protein